MTEENSKTNRKPAENNQKLSNYDELAIQVCKNNPELSNEQIGKELVRLGVSKNPKTMHTRWYRNDYLKREITEVRNHNLSEIQRKIVPKSLKKLSKLVGDDDKKIQMQAINTTLKYGMGEMVNMPGVGINIGHIEKIQVAINQDLGLDNP